MPLKNQLTDDMKQAMKARDMVRLNTIRFLQAEIRNVEIDNGEQDDAGVQKIVARQIKQLKEGIEEYRKAGRDETVAEEEQKVAVLQQYLPAQLSDEEVITLIKEVTAGGDVSNRGQVIGQVMQKVAGRADGSRVAQLVAQQLA